MKNYNQMAADVFRRIAEYETEQKRKRKMLIGAAASLCCVCLIVLIAFGGRQIGRVGFAPSASTVIGEKSDNTESKEDNASMPVSAQTDSRELQSRINKLESDSADKIGWVVYEDRIYTQIQNIDISNIEPDRYLGRAGDFRGAYQNEKLGTGDLYCVAGDPDLILVKLDNGGTILLGAED